MSCISELLMVNSRGDVLPDKDFLGHLKIWESSQPTGTSFGPVLKYVWKADSSCYERLNARNDHFRPLPDASGFLLCENVERADNLLLLDAFGKERMRLAVPWQLTRQPDAKSAAYPSRFIGLTTPWENPKTGAQGKFAVLAWVQYAGDYAFELNWQTGEFLWGYYLERG